MNSSSSLAAPNSSSSTNFTEPPYNSTVSYQISVALSWIELVPLCALFLASLLNSRLLIGSAILHPNLKAILLAQSGLIIVYSITRLAEVYIELTAPATFFLSPFYWTLNHINLVCILYGNLIGHILIVERSMASLFARRYEHWNGWWRLICLCLLLLLVLISLSQWLAPSLGASSSTFGFGVVITHLALLFSVGELIAFAVLNAHNRNSYNRFNNIHENYAHRYQLSERYQMLENIYTGRQLAPSFVLHTLNILCSNIVCALNYVVIPFWASGLLVSTIMVVHALSKLGIEISVITFHPVLSKRLQQMLTAAARTFGSKQRTARVTSETVGGAHEANNGCLRSPEQDEHFKMLKKFWQ